jgi:putative ABC transport system permease protein
MLLTDVLRLSVKTFTDKRFRAALTILGISIGPLALVMIYGVTSGYSDYVVKQLKGLGQNLVVVMPNHQYTLTENDLRTLTSIPGVVDSTPYYSTQGKIRVPGGEMGVLIYAVRYDFIFKVIPSLKLAEGSIPAENDIVKCIIGHDIAYDQYGNRQYHIGDAITITVYNVESSGRIVTHRVTFLIAGILSKYGGAAFLNPDQAIFVSTEAGEKILGLKKWSGVLLYVEDTSLINSVTQRIKDLYGDAVSVTSFYAIAQIASSITGAVNFMTFAASLAAFAVAVAGVAATMITSVIERTREIGVLKALGFTDGQVLTLILSEGIIMSLIGAAIGISLGAIGAYALAERGLVIHAGATSMVVKAPPNLTPLLIGATLVLTILVGIAGSIFPAYRAAKIPPAVALRYE